MATPTNLSEFSALLEIIARLRAPDGCPWDREQTHQSLAPNLIEECYEVLETLDSRDTSKLCQELGDVLMQVVLHSQIAAESGEFTINDVIKSISAKLIHRHPHVFGETRMKNSQEVVHNWEVLKRQERPAGTALLSGVPKNMPALAYAQAIQLRAANVGFDWPDIEGVIDKVAEEVNELKEAPSTSEKENEFGDLLFTLVNVARRMHIDPETALRHANGRFYERFSRMEEICRGRGLSLDRMSLSEKDALWEEAKRQLQK